MEGDEQKVKLGINAGSNKIGLFLLFMNKYTIKFKYHYCPTKVYGLKSKYSV